MEVNWELLARKVGALRDGQSEFGSNKLAAAALCELIGDKTWKEAIENCIVATPGYGLIQSVLSLLRPKVAMEYCYEIYKSERSIEDKRYALILLKSVANRDAVHWIAEFLGDSDELIQIFGAEVLDQMAVSGVLDDDDEDLIELFETCEKHPNESVRQKIASTKTQIAVADERENLMSTHFANRSEN
jgi:hypothetical protein